jgi:hypothetical protein
MNSKDLTWMHRIGLANEFQQQNLEIIYNDNKIYYKTLKKIKKNEQLMTFPSKDLEISLGLQYVPINKSINKIFSSKNIIINLNDVF